jgi:hypothetical protein
MNGVAAPAVLRFVCVPNAVSSSSAFLALTSSVYVVADVSPDITSPSICASVSHTADADGLPLPSTYLPFHVASVGLVVFTKTAKAVVGFADGFPFSVFKSVIVDCVWFDFVGAPGVAALVYVVLAVDVLV